MIDPWYKVVFTSEQTGMGHIVWCDTQREAEGLAKGLGGLVIPPERASIEYNRETGKVDVHYV